MDIHQYLSKEEIKQLTQKSDLKAAWEIAKTWLWVAFAFALPAWYPSILSYLIALFILGGKQLACAIIMHDASHRALFRTTWLNDFAGNWLGGYMIVNDLHRYRPYHLKHHTHTGTSNDPDLPLTKGYPTTVKSFMRKISRDMFGLTAIKAQIGLFFMNIGYWHYNLGGLVQKINQTGRKTTDYLLMFLRNYLPPILANATLWGILWLCGVGHLYALWVLAYFTTFQFSLRIRSMAEHSMVPNPLDNHQNTRTTYANWLEQLLFAPHHVNYHVEHHLLMSVPPYHLPTMHRLIKQRGYYQQGVLEHNYWAVIKKAMQKKPQIT